MSQGPLHSQERVPLISSKCGEFNENWERNQILVLHIQDFNIEMIIKYEQNFLE